MTVYKVGGCVRDELLNKKPKDIDYVVVNSSPAEMLSKKYKQVGNDFPVFLHPKTHEEYALARTEKKTGKSYTDFSCEWENVSLEEDLFRRDFTINSIAKDQQNNFVDPYNGIADIENKILRHTNPNSFKDDPLRILRLARFYAQLQDFRIYHGTRKLAKEMVADFKNGTLTLTPERIILETNKALMSDVPSKYFYFLDEIDLLEVLYPELHNMTKLEHGSKHHMEGSVFEHTMMVIDNSARCNENIEVRYMCLYHDIGKTVTCEPSKKEPLNAFVKRFSFHDHENYDKVKPLVDGLKNRYKLSNNIYNSILWSASLHSFIFRVLHKEHRAGTIVSKIRDSRFPKKYEDIHNLFRVAYYDAIGRITDNSGKIGNYTSELAEDLAKVVFYELHKISMKEYIDSKPEASVDDIKQRIHREGIRILNEYYIRNGL